MKEEGLPHERGLYSCQVLETTCRMQGRALYFQQLQILGFMKPKPPILLEDPEKYLQKTENHQVNSQGLNRDSVRSDFFKWFQTEIVAKVN